MGREDKSKTIDVVLKTNDVLTKYIKEMNEDVKLSSFNIREKSLTCSSIWAKWISYLFLERENLQRIVNAKAKLLKSKTASSPSTSLLKMKTEDKLEENDETMQKLTKLGKDTQDCIDYIERSLNVLNSFGFSIKNAIDALKLELSH
jgi:hypothetical protein